MSTTEVEVSLQPPVEASKSSALVTEAEVAAGSSTAGSNADPDEKYNDGNQQPLPAVHAAESTENMASDNSIGREGPMAERELSASDLASQLKELQKKLANLTEKVEKVPQVITADDDDDDDDDGTKLEPEIKRFPMSKYSTDKLTFSDFSKNVLVAYYKKMSSAAKGEQKPGDTDESETVAQTDVQTGVPERLQINSRILLDSLEQIGGTKLAASPTVMLPPYKMLVVRRNDIEDEIGTKEQVVQTYNDNEKPPDSRIGPKTKTEHDKEEEMKQEKTVIGQLRILLNFIDHDLKSILDFRRQVEDLEVQKVSFDNLWHLFNPGDLVFAAPKRGTDDLPKAYRAHCVTGGRAKTPGDRRKASTEESEEKNDSSTDPYNRLKLYLDCYYIDFDGHKYGPKDECLDIMPYDGEKLITELDVYPARFHNDHKEIFDKLRARGRRFQELCGVSHKYYDGLTLKKDPEEVQGEVVIDFKTGYQYAPNTLIDEDLSLGKLAPTDPGDSDTFEGYRCSIEGCTTCTKNYYDRLFDWKRHEDWKEKNQGLIRLLDPEKDEIPDQYLELLPKELLGYVFKSRSWYFLDVDKVQNIDDSHESRGFDELVIEPEHKDLLLALVQNHSSGKKRAERGKKIERTETSTNMDLIRGKGRGLIILLHGAPGVGKTLTAETIAAYTRRPLYPITCGDIGQTPSDIETKLEHHFKLAHKWGCVLLLDEADVFLARRERGDVKRNGLVSVFLRVLEYYSGILFLTTNQVGVFDEAFKSRIHISLYYPQLDHESTRKLWTNHLERIRRQNETRSVPIEADDDEILSFGLKHFEKRFTTTSVWNGRQIRNAFQTAIALAEYDRAEKLRKKGITPEEARESKKYRQARLTKAHFKKVAKASEHFDDYMRHVRHGKDESDQLHASEIRSDNWREGIAERPPKFRNKSSSNKQGTPNGLSKKISGSGVSTAAFLETPSSKKGKIKSPPTHDDDEDSDRVRRKHPSKKHDSSSDDDDDTSSDDDSD